MQPSGIFYDVSLVSGRNNWSVSGHQMRQSNSLSVEKNFKTLIENLYILTVGKTDVFSDRKWEETFDSDLILECLVWLQHLSRAFQLSGQTYGLLCCFQVQICCSENEGNVSLRNSPSAFSVSSNDLMFLMGPLSEIYQHFVNQTVTKNQFYL